MAQNDKPVRRKPKPKHSAVHFTVWSVNGTPFSPALHARIEAAVQSTIEGERVLMAVTRV